MIAPPGGRAFTCHSGPSIMVTHASAQQQLFFGGQDRLLNWVAHALAFGISKGAVFES
jgi:hypothetical protein